MKNRQLLAIIGTRFPSIYDVTPPRYDVGSLRGPLAALNPQPLPPRELGAAIAGEFVHTAWLADRLGLDPGVALTDLDDWCPTQPRKVKLPRWWPPVPEPEPHPNWFVDLHLGFAARVAAVSGDIEGTRLAAVFDKAIERSVGAIESAKG